MIFVFEFMNDEFDYAIFNALHNPDLNEFNEDRKSTRLNSSH